MEDFKRDLEEWETLYQAYLAGRRTETLSVAEEVDMEERLAELERRRRAHNDASPFKALEEKAFRGSKRAIEGQDSDEWYDFDALGASDRGGEQHAAWASRMKARETALQEERNKRAATRRAPPPAPQREVVEIDVDDDDAGCSKQNPIVID